MNIIKISAISQEGFNEVKEAIKNFNNDFLNSFQEAERKLISIKLISNDFCDGTIKLPEGFLIKRIDYLNYKEFEEKQDEAIKTNLKYKVEIFGEYKEQNYELIYNNLSNPKISIH